MSHRSDRYRRSQFTTAIFLPGAGPAAIRSLILAISIVCSLIPTLALEAQGDSSTIRGLVVDAETGSPLHGVNILLLTAEGDTTTLGAMTGSDGRYRILSVPPGTWILQAGMMGYETLRVREFAVGADRLCVQDFHLPPVVLEAGQIITVTAPLDVLRRDVTGSRESLTATQMMDLPAQSTTDILALQTSFYIEQGFEHNIPGYRDRGLQQLHVRGGRNAEVAFMIDGLQVTNLVFGGQAMKTNPTALEEMVIMASGVSAEYGNALSGVVNFVTRSGGPRYEGNLELLSSEFGSAPDDARDLTTSRGFLGGPVPRLPGLTFFLSGSATTARDFLVHRDDIVFDFEVDPRDPATRRNDIEYDHMPEDWLEFDPDEHDPYYQRETATGHGWRIYPQDSFSGWYGYGYNTEWDVLANLSQRIGRSMRLKLSLLRNRRVGVPYTSDWRFAMFWGLPAEVQQLNVFGVDRWDATRLDPWTGDPIYEGDGDELIWGTGLTDFHNEKNVLEKDHARIAAVWTHQPHPSTFYTLRFSYLDYDRTMRVKRWVNDDGYVPRLDHLNDEYPTWIPGDELHQVTLQPLPYSTGTLHERTYGYFPVGGAGYSTDGSDRYFSNQYDTTRHLRLDITSQLSGHHLIKGGVEYKRLTLDNYAIQLLYLTPPYITQYRHTPTEFSLYLQDKIEYRYVVFNVGLRLDSGNSGDLPFWLHPMNPMDTERNLVIDPSDPETAPCKRTGRRRALSPRLGLAIPLSTAAVFFANYGHFYQYPIYRNCYLQGTLEDSVPLIGNPDLQMEFAAKYEFGCRAHLSELVILQAVAWSKDQSNLVGTIRVPAFHHGVSNPHDYTVFMNKDYAVCRGIDLSLSRRFSGLWSGRLAYSWITSEMNAEDPWAGYRGGHELETGPKRRRPTGWDRPHTLSGLLSLILPEGFGPQIAGLRPFERAGASLVYRGSSGRPYTPTTRYESLETRSARMPWKSQWDLRAWRDVRLLGLECGLLVNIRNLFDTRIVQSVYSATGSPIDPGPGATAYSENYDRSHYFGSPRLIDIGFRVRF